MKPFIWCCSWSPSRKSRWGSALVRNGSILMLCPPVLWASMTMCSDAVVVRCRLCTISLYLLLLRFLHSLCKKSEISATIESCESEYLPGCMSWVSLENQGSGSGMCCQWDMLFMVTETEFTSAFDIRLQYMYMGQVIPALETSNLKALMESVNEIGYRNVHNPHYNWVQKWSLGNTKTWCFQCSSWIRSHYVLQAWNHYSRTWMYWQSCHVVVACSLM